MKEEVLNRYIQGECSIEENLQVAEWLEANPATNLQKLNELRFIYEFSLMHPASTTPAQLGNHQPQVKESGGLLWRNLGRYTIRIAAAIALIVIGGYAAQYKIYNTINNQYTVLQVPNGQRIQVTLSDGSNVWLNSGARLEYPVAFAQNSRKVKLTGEALFDVKHENKRAFEVETFASNIRVLGTKFNVNADKITNSFSTTLLQGAVGITNLLNPEQQEIIMRPNDVVNLSNGRLMVTQAKDPEVLCWTEGLVNISGLSFNQLMLKFEQVFDVKIVIASHQAPQMGAISGKIRINDGIENALHILQYAANFTYTKDLETNIITIH